jgi:6-phosphogluconate dehydrogenase (decarboxylating)
MQMGMVGLGRMGASMVQRLMRGGHECVVYDVNAGAVARVVKEGAAMRYQFGGHLEKDQAAAGAGKRDSS